MNVKRFDFLPGNPHFSYGCDPDTVGRPRTYANELFIDYKEIFPELFRAQSWTSSLRVPRGVFDPIRIRCFGKLTIRFTLTRFDPSIPSWRKARLPITA